jgi:hypothetical protein
MEQLLQNDRRIMVSPKLRVKATPSNSRQKHSILVQGITGICPSPAVSGNPNRIFMFCTA